MRRMFVVLSMVLSLGIVSEALAASTPTFTATMTSTFTATPTPTFTATPTLTPTLAATLTISATATISETITVSLTPTEVINRLVKVNHNFFNPLEGQTLDIQNLNTHHEDVTIRVYSQTGHLIKELIKGERLPRDTVVSWDGRNSANQVVASGVYIVIVHGKKLDKRFRVAVIK